MAKWFRSSSSPLDVSGDIEHSREHSLISAGLQINGDVKFAGTLRIDGRVDGKVSVHSGKKGVLILSQEAIINGPVITTDLICDGTINGNVKADGKVEFRPHSSVRGEVQYQLLQIAEGAVIEGRCLQRSPSDLPLSLADESPKTETATKKEVVTFLRKEAASS